MFCVEALRSVTAKNLKEAKGMNIGKILVNSYVEKG